MDIGWEVALMKWTLAPVMVDGDRRIVIYSLKASDEPAQLLRIIM